MFKKTLGNGDNAQKTSYAALPRSDVSEAVRVSTQTRRVAFGSTTPKTLAAHSLSVLSLRRGRRDPMETVAQLVVRRVTSAGLAASPGATAFGWHGVPGDYSFPLHDALEDVPAARWFGDCNELCAGCASRDAPPGSLAPPRHAPLAATRPTATPVWPVSGRYSSPMVRLSHLPPRSLPLLYPRCRRPQRCQRNRGRLRGACASGGGLLRAAGRRRRRNCSGAHGAPLPGARRALRRVCHSAGRVRVRGGVADPRQRG